MIAQCVNDNIGILIPYDSPMRQCNTLSCFTVTSKLKTYYFRRHMDN